MQDCPPSEVDVLLAQPLVCVDCDEWTPLAIQRGTSIAEAGIVGPDGVSTGLMLQLLFRRSMKTGTLYYKLTIFRKSAWGLDRVYQLAVRQSAGRLGSQHQLPHEHWGAQRTVGRAEWSNWSYDDILEYFCERTKISFSPRPPHPEDFALKG